MQAAADSFETELVPGFKKWLDTQPDFIDYDSSPINQFIEDDLKYYIKKLMAPIGVDAQTKNYWVAQKHREIYTKLKAFVKARRKGGNLSKADYYQLVGQTVNLLGGRAKIQNAAKTNLSKRKSLGLLESKKSNFS